MEERADESVRELENVAKQRRQQNSKFNKYNKSKSFSVDNSPFNEDGDKLDPDEVASIVAEQRRGQALKQNLFSPNKPYQRPDTSDSE